MKIHVSLYLVHRPLSEPPVVWMGQGEEHCHEPGSRVEMFTHLGLEPPEQTGISAETH